MVHSQDITAALSVYLISIDDSLLIDLVYFRLCRSLVVVRLTMGVSFSLPLLGAGGTYIATAMYFLNNPLARHTMNPRIQRVPLIAHRLVYLFVAMNSDVVDNGDNVTEEGQGKATRTLLSVTSTQSRPELECWSWMFI